MTQSFGGEFAIRIAGIPVRLVDPSIIRTDAVSVRKAEYVVT